MKGKHLLLSLTVGGGEDHYREDGQNRYPVEEFLYSFEQLAALCQMKYENPICSFGTAYIQGVSIEADRNRVTAVFISRAKKLLDVLHYIRCKRSFE
ncbi:NAD(P)H-dependent oxidoreductase [Allisonella histaminiformans]|uniref:NAD(P)H-dependent oxidoreductase n=1 Tax=Allisonella histaminiformans TaxID=209880 RepID=UPI002804F8E4|nr:NAD(P)H-dependent oxidoreductase [Allisonella histaminiformans]